MALTSAARSDSGTGLRHRKLRTLLQGHRPRPPGSRKAPVLLRLDPPAGTTPSERPPVRIFVGSEPAQYRAERVLIWSILQVRNPARAYEIHLLKDLQGFDRSDWNTGFDGYRYAVPALAGGGGRAIYNDVGQMYLADPALLFDADMGDAGVLAAAQDDLSLMLLDCEKMAGVWPLARLDETGLRGPLPPAWSDGSGESLLRFGALHEQPWQPFPHELRYRPHDQAGRWHALERAADAAGFTPFTQENPSPRYHELLAMYKTMHEVGRPDAGRGAEKTFSGKSLVEHIKPIARLIREHGAKTILDFGSGKAGLYRDAPGYPAGSRYKVMDPWKNALVTCYDPGYEPFAAPYEAAYDGVVTTDVLEHIPEEDIAWVLDELFGHARQFLYAVAACYPAKKLLPDGANAHCTLQPPEWWQGQMELAARRHPHVRWVLCTQQPSALAFGQRKKLFKKGIRSRFFSGVGCAPA